MQESENDGVEDQEEGVHHGEEDPGGVTTGGGVRGLTSSVAAGDYSGKEGENYGYLYQKTEA